MIHFNRALTVICLLLALSFGALAMSADEARELLASGRMNDAITALKAQTQADSKNAEAFHLLSRAYYALERWDECITAAQQAVTLNPKSSDYHLWLGRSLGNKAEHSSWFTALRLARRTRSEFESAVALNNANVDARSDLAEYYMEAPGFLGGGADKARAQAEQLAGYDAAAAHWVRARLAEKDNHLADAEKEYRAAIETSKNPGGEWLNLASFYRRTNRYKEMDDAINKAVSLDDKRKANLFYEAASLLYRAGRNIPVAAQFARKSINARQHDDEAPAFKAHYLLGEVLEKQGDKHAAADEYRSALAMASDYRQAQDALKRVEQQ